MKYCFFILSLFLIVSSCKVDRADSVSITEKFVKNIYISESYLIQDVNKYMTKEYVDIYNSLSPKEKKTHEQYIKSMIDEVRSILNDNDLQYEILNKEDIRKHYPLDNIILDDGGEVFMLKSKNRLLFSFIVKNNKIHSFCPDMYLSTKNKKIPYFFGSTTDYFKNKPK